MAIPQGSRLGPYEITGILGAGGMGEVYRARDPRLNRDVAVKVLPELFASDPGRLARFEREAQLLESLNHPQIAHIYGIEQAGNTRALVMELVEGDDLAARIARGPLPTDEAVLTGMRTESPSWMASTREGFAVARAPDFASTLEHGPQLLNGPVPHRC